MSIERIFRNSCAALFAASLLLPGCRKDGPAAVDLGYGYFPVKQGLWVEYVVDSSWNFEPLGVSGAVRYRLREVIDSVYIDPAGRIAQRIERSVWDSVEAEWRIKDVWTQTRQAAQAERTEENLRLLKMVFPVRAGQRWNLNAFNDQSDLEMGYADIDRPWQQDGLFFDSTVVVRSYFPNNLVDTLIIRERYARNVGLVERLKDTSNTQPAGTTGWYFRQVVTAHGD